MTSAKYNKNKDVILSRVNWRRSSVNKSTLHIKNPGVRFLLSWCESSSQSRKASPATTSWLTPPLVSLCLSRPRSNEKLRSQRWTLMAFINTAWAAGGTSSSLHRPCLSPGGRVSVARGAQRNIIKANT